MAVQQLQLAFGQISGTTEVEIYTVPAEVTVQPFLVLTNAGSDLVEVEVTITTSSIDRVLKTKKIAGGSGQSLRVLEMSDIRIKEADSVNLRLIQGGPVNYFLSGVQYDVA